MKKPKNDFAKLVKLDKSISKQIDALAKRKTLLQEELGKAVAAKYIEKFEGKWYCAISDGTYKENAHEFYKLVKDQLYTDTYVVYTIKRSWAGNSLTLDDHRFFPEKLQMTLEQFKDYQVVPESFVKELVESYEDSLNELFKK